MKEHLRFRKFVWKVFEIGRYLILKLKKSFYRLEKIRAINSYFRHP
jgi:hypothetical protein